MVLMGHSGNTRIRRDWPLMRMRTSKGTRFFKLTGRPLMSRFTVPGRLVDLGCGAGRHAIHFAARGFAVTAVDLSRSMLRVVGLKAAETGVELLRIQANLCRLGCVPDQSFDYAISMFSTLGMIRGRASRRTGQLRKSAGFCGRGARSRCTCIISGSTCAIHRAGGMAVHHGMPRTCSLVVIPWAIAGWTIVGLTACMSHLYRWGELKRELGSAGFRVAGVIPLDEVSAKPIFRPWLAPGLRAGGWIVFAARA